MALRFSVESRLFISWSITNLSFFMVGAVLFSFPLNIWVAIAFMLQTEINMETSHTKKYRKILDFPLHNYQYF